MDRLRRSFRDSFRRRKDPHVPESSKPHQWQADETAVRSATCAFHVKVLQSRQFIIALRTNLFILNGHLLFQKASLILDKAAYFALLTDLLTRLDIYSAKLTYA